MKKMHNPPPPAGVRPAPPPPPPSPWEVRRRIKASPLLQLAARRALDFMNSIEGAGYGGMAVYEIARQDLIYALAEAEAPS